MAKAKFGGIRNLGDGSGSVDPPVDMTNDLLDADMILRSIGISDDYTGMMERADVAQYLNEIQSRPDTGASNTFHHQSQLSSDLLTLVSGTQETMLNRLVSARDLELSAPGGLIAPSQLTCTSAGGLTTTTVGGCPPTYSAVGISGMPTTSAGGMTTASTGVGCGGFPNVSTANGVFLPTPTSASGGPPSSVFMLPVTLQERSRKRPPNMTATAVSAFARSQVSVHGEFQADSPMQVMSDTRELREMRELSPRPLSIQREFSDHPMSIERELSGGNMRDALMADEDSETVLRNLLSTDFQMQDDTKPVVSKPEFFSLSSSSQVVNRPFSMSQTVIVSGRDLAHVPEDQLETKPVPHSFNQSLKTTSPNQTYTSSSHQTFKSSSNQTFTSNQSFTTASNQSFVPSSNQTVLNQNLHQKIRLELRPADPPVFTMPSSLPPSSPTFGEQRSPAGAWKQEQPPSPRTSETSPRHTPRPSPASTPPTMQCEPPARGDTRQWRRSGRSTPTGKRSRPQTPTSEGELSDGGYREREPHGWSTGRSTPVEVKPSTRLEDMVDEDKYNKRKRSTSDGERGKKDPIKSMLEQLQSHIPHIGNPDQEKVSHAGLLIEGSDYIRSLMRENKSTKENVEALKVKIEELNKEIEAAQEKLPEHGSTAIHRILSTRGKSIPDMFADHVRQRTQEDWRYWVFTSIMGHFVHSFAQDVSNISPKEMDRTTLEWIQERMSMQQLRKDAFRKLAKLCSKTSIMENPSILPEEARGFVALPDQPAKEEIEEDPPAFRNKY